MGSGELGAPTEWGLGAWGVEGEKLPITNCLDLMPDARCPLPIAPLSFRCDIAELN